MTQQSRFGGAWTRRKLACLEKYLKSYLDVFKNQPYFTTVYIDAFAGTGKIPESAVGTKSLNALPGLDIEDVQGLIAGSAGIALSLESAFSEYIFIEKDSNKCAELEALKVEFPAHASRITIVNDDANTYLTKWCKDNDLLASRTRAVVFLDPFGMQVKWPLLEAIAATKAIDLWLLVPIGIGVNRMMPKSALPTEQWSQRLTEFFGSEEWKTMFYRTKRQQDLFGDGTDQERNTDYDGLVDYFIERLKSIFQGVASNPVTLRNSKNSPLFLLCFAAGNPKGALPALRIAQHLLKELARGD